MPHLAAHSRVESVVAVDLSEHDAGQSINDLMKHPPSPLSRGADFRTKLCNDLDDESAA